MGPKEMDKGREKVNLSFKLALPNHPLLPGLAMNTVVSKVCNNLHSGTDGWVRLRFRSRKFKFRQKDETYICDQGARKCMNLQI